MKIAPSILSADFGRLGDQVREAEEAGADWIHVDVMDGHFVPNITIGPAVTEAVRAATTLPVDVHLMIESPERHLAAFAEAGADWITVHAECCPHLHRTLEQIRALGARPGVALNPGTSLDAVAEVLPYLDLLLVMTVNPGFGGQRFIPTSIGKIARASALLASAGDRPEEAPAVELQVDGGVDAVTAPEVMRAGATVAVAGSAVFGHPDGVETAIRALRDAMAEAGRHR
jgi:ribulose-phosphate 3-epimerase